MTHFDSDVASVKPNLVIWETGVTDAVRGTNIEEFRKALQKGLTKLKAVVPETMLMDIQYSRATSLVTSSTSYMTMLHGVAALNQTAVFPRNEIMRNWEETNTFNYNINGQSERRVLATRLYDCLGQAVANAIVRKSPVRSDK